MKQLDPKAVWLFFFNSIISLFVIIVFCIPLILSAIVWSTDNNDSVGGAIALFLLIIIVVLIANFIWAKLTYHFYRYELVEMGFRKELGIISKKYVTIPYDRIQNVDIHRGILSRILGLSDIRIQTAGMSGGGGAEGSLPGISAIVAEELRDELIKRATQVKSQGL